MTGKGKKARLGCICCFRLRLGFEKSRLHVFSQFNLVHQVLIDAIDFFGAALDPFFKILIAELKLVLNTNEVTNVIIGGDIAAIGKRGSFDLYYLAVLVFPHDAVRLPVFKVLKTFVYKQLYIASAQQASVRIELHKL